MPKREARAEVKVSVENLNLDQRRGNSNAFRYEHQVGEDGRPIPVGPEILQKFVEERLQSVKSRVPQLLVLLFKSTVIMERKG